MLFVLATVIIIVLIIVSGTPEHMSGSGKACTESGKVWVTADQSCVPYEELVSRCNERGFWDKNSMSCKVCNFPMKNDPRNGNCIPMTAQDQCVHAGRVWDPHVSACFDNCPPEMPNRDPRTGICS